MLETFYEISTVAFVVFILITGLTVLTAAAIIFISGLEHEDYLDD